MNEQQGTENAYENSAYDMIGSSMLVVSEEDAVKFLGRNGLLQLMVDGINGVLTSLLLRVRPAVLEQNALEHESSLGISKVIQRSPYH